ncbi:hypothetical protein LSPH24S_05185 [Lysinibacillus sphaericus]
MNYYDPYYSDYDAVFGGFMVVFYFVLLGMIICWVRCECTYLIYGFENKRF